MNHPTDPQPTLHVPISHDAGADSARTPAHMAGQGRGLTAIDGAMGLIAVLLVVQMWLLTTTLQLDLAGHEGVVVPAALLSLVLFAGCFGLFWLVNGIDARVRRR